MSAYGQPLAGGRWCITLGVLATWLAAGGLTGCLKQGRVKPVASRPPATVPQPPPAAPEPPPPPPPEVTPATPAPAFSEELKSLARQRRAELLAKAPPYDRRPLTRQLVQKKYGVDLDTLFPDGIYDWDRLKSESEVKELIFRRAGALANREYPPELRQRLADQAAVNIPLYRVGDLVATVSSNRNLTIKGRLDVVCAGYIVVGGQRILLVDLKSPGAEHFDPAAVERRRTQFVRNNYDNARSECIRRQQTELAPAVYRECGYIARPARPGQSGYVSLRVLMPKEIAPLVDQDEAEYRRDVKREIEQTVIREFRRAGRLGGAPQPATPPAPAN